MRACGEGGEGSKKYHSILPGTTTIDPEHHTRSLLEWRQSWRQTSINLCELLVAWSGGDGSGGDEKESRSLEAWVETRQYCRSQTDDYTSLVQGVVDDQGCGYATIIQNDLNAM